MANWLDYDEAYEGGGSRIAGTVKVLRDVRSAELDNTRRLGLAPLTHGDVVDYRDSLERRDRFAPASVGLLGAGAALAITGALLYFIDSPRVEL